MPKVSVIIPVYNVEKYLYECLDSIVNQTYKNIEIICIDDSSTDKSIEILREYANKDNRIIILQQRNQGAAVARNYGMDIAQGKYLLFLDSDDVFSESLIEKAVLKAEKFNADIVVYKAMTFDTSNNCAVMKDYISGFKYGQEKTFSYIDVPDKIFNSFLIPAWNKLFKKSFIIENDIFFQNIKRYNDLYFSNKALVAATKIILLDEILLFYRVGLKSNLQSNKEKTPFEICKALNALKSYLEVQGIFMYVRKSFLKLVTDNIFYNLNGIKNIESRKLYINKLRSEWFEELGITNGKDLMEVSILAYWQYKVVLVSENRVILKSLYAIDKLWEYYKLTGLKNTVRKVLTKR